MKSSPTTVYTKRFPLEAPYRIDGLTTREAIRIMFATVKLKNLDAILNAGDREAILLDAGYCLDRVLSSIEY
jgi:hypothetical protein